MTNISEPNQPIRELYEEFPVGARTVSMISDPENPNAWIQSTVTQAIEE